MARKERVKVAAVADRLGALLAAGDHGGARAEARRVAADPGAAEADRAHAAEVARSLSPERAAVILGAFSVALAAVIAAWLLSR